MAIHLRVEWMSVQWIGTMLNFSYESFPHHGFLPGKLDIHNDVVKIEIMKK